MQAQRFIVQAVCTVLVCLRCDASHTETLPRDRAIDA
jgi:ribosomal protein L40E